AVIPAPSTMTSPSGVDAVWIGPLATGVPLEGPPDGADAGAHPPRMRVATPAMASHPARAGVLLVIMVKPSSRAVACLAEPTGDTRGESARFNRVRFARASRSE